jgi:hypothetical protein
MGMKRVDGDTREVYQAAKGKPEEGRRTGKGRPRLAEEDEEAEGGTLQMSGSHLCIPRNETVISKTQL